MNYDTQGLAQAGLDLVPPFTVDVRLEPVVVDVAHGDGSVLDESITPLEFVSVTRVLPGRRLSGVVQDLAGDQYFAKVFYGRGARRYWHRELVGATALGRSGAASPKKINQGATADGDGFVVLYEVLREAVAPGAYDLPQVSAVVAVLAQLHESRLVQTDPHLENFLCSNQQMYVVDADGVRPGRKLQAQLDNLAAFFAQRAPVCDEQIGSLWQAYLSLRDGYVARMADLETIQKLTARQRRLRVRRYLKKTQRSCSEFVHKKTWSRAFLCQRDAWPELQRFMWFPEAFFGEGTPLKLGNSATVVRIEVNGRHYIVKRYNIKHLSHRIRRWFKRRARIAWINGHHLDFLDSPTAKPVALLELKWGWFVGVSYLIMPDVGEHSLLDELERAPEAFDYWAQQALGILKALQAADLQHGDLKATNLVVKDKALALIDYDAVTPAPRRDGQRSRDVTRFIQNFADDPQLERWEHLVKEAGL